MRYLSRVVWSEGMYLAPHHFQAQSRYFEDSIVFATNSLWFKCFGVSGLELDGEALRNGVVAVIHGRGIFPDGLVFNMPECEPVPDSRNIADLFSPMREHQTLMLAVPARREGKANYAAADGANTLARYVPDSQVHHDENTGRDEKPVRVGRKNIRLLLDTEISDDLVTLPIARIRRDGSGNFVYDPTFIPPCLEISASDHLMMILRRLIEILDDKCERLSAAGQGDKISLVEHSSREVANFWFLHTVNASLAPLRHLFYAKRGHPEELYKEMARLGGGLCTFALESHPRQVPLYDHLRLDECFGELDHHIRSHLELVLPTNCVPIPLTRAEKYFWSGPVTDQRLLDRSRWIFAIRSGVGEADLIRRAPQLVKICSSKFVGELVKRALPGMALTHLQVPPSAITRKLEWQYFSVSKSGGCWDHIVKSREVGVYVPGDLPDPELELMVVLEA
jgi:type VI secretion system protein ImpJ